MGFLEVIWSKVFHVIFVSLGLLICSASCQLEFAKYDFGFENNLDGVYIEGITDIDTGYCLNDLSHCMGLIISPAYE